MPSYLITQPFEVKTEKNITNIKFILKILISNILCELVTKWDVHFLVHKIKVQGEPVVYYNSNECLRYSIEYEITEEESSCWRWNSKDIETFLQKPFSDFLNKSITGGVIFYVEISLIESTVAIQTRILYEV